MHYIMKVGPSADNNHVVPQVENMGPGYNWDAPDSVTRISENVPLAHAPNFHAFHLDPLTVLTDIISQSYIRARGLLVSPPFVRTLEEYQVQRHQLYEADVVLNGGRSEYYWMHMIEKAEDSIDYANSAFRLESLEGGAGEAAAISSSEDLQETVKRLIETMEGRLKPSLLTFLSRDSLNDLFCLDLPVRTFFLSSRLRDDLVSARLTGFALVPTDLKVVSP
ncbi:MAG TPA: hypothetical protein DC054_10745 [Blastocatellia bacterium]|nr:hypothetical protein [Blastocatellia bacterium]